MGNYVEEKSRSSKDMKEKKRKDHRVSVVIRGTREGRKWWRGRYGERTDI